MQITGTPQEREEIILAIAEAAGRSLSRSKANKLMKRSLAGEFDPQSIGLSAYDLARYLPYADPVGEHATSNLLRDQIRREAA
ncbi:hypothetical protein [Kocuria sp. U4B]